MVESLPGENPAGVRPPGALARRMRITVLIRMLMVDAMSGHPEDGAAFECERAAPCQHVFDPFVRLVATVGEEPVVAHPDAQHSGHDVENQRGEHGAPIDEQQCGNRREVEARHRGHGDGVQPGLILPPVRQHRRSHACDDISARPSPTVIVLYAATVRRPPGGRGRGRCGWPAWPADTPQEQPLQEPGPSWRETPRRPGTKSSEAG